MGCGRCGVHLSIPGTGIEFLDFVIDADLLRKWADLGSTHAVTQSEPLPVLVACLVWKDALRNQHLIHFTNNAAVKDLLVKGSSHSLSCCDVLHKIAAEESTLGLRSWVCRIPLESDPADAPSRGRPEELAKRFDCLLTLP